MASTLSLLMKDRKSCLDPYTIMRDLSYSLYCPPSLVKRMTVDTCLDSHEGCVNCIHFSNADGSRLVSGSDDLHLVVWDWTKEKELIKFDSKHITNVFQAKFMPQTNDSVLVSAARDGQVRRHVISSCGHLMGSDKVAYHNDSAHKLAIEPDNPHVFLSCGEDGSVLEIDLRIEIPQRNKLLVCKNHQNFKLALYSVFIDPSNYNRFAISGRDQYARIYDRRLLASSRSEESKDLSCDPIQTFCPSHLVEPSSEVWKANITCLVYSHDGKELLCSYNDENIYTFDTTAGKSGLCTEYVNTFEGHRNRATVKGVNYFGLQSEYIVSGSDCGHVFLWDKKTANVVQYFEGDIEGVVNCLEPHPHVPVLAVSGLDHSVKICTPSACTSLDQDELKEVTTRNIEERKTSSSSLPSNSYDFLLDFIMSQYSRRMRRRLHQHDRNESSSSSSSSGDERLENSDEEGERGEGEEGEERQWRNPLFRQLIWQYHHGNEGEEEEEEEEDHQGHINCRQS